MQYRKRAAERISLDGSEILRELDLSRGSAGPRVRTPPAPARRTHEIHAYPMRFGEWGAGWGERQLFTD